MNVTVSIPTPFRRHTDGLDHLECIACKLDDLFDSLETRFPELKRHLRDREGRVRHFLHIYVNDEDIRFLGVNYAFHEGDEITIFPTIAPEGRENEERAGRL
jgi:sulfur-carrier protein